MAKSRARFLSELLGTTGLVKKSKSALAGADEIIDLSTLPSIPNSKLTNSSITINSNATSLGGSVTLTTANVAENTNLYYTDARADARIAAADTGDLSEGSNLYYTNARADARVNLQTGSNLDLSSKDTGDLSEGSNLYYTNARADARIAAASTSDLSEGTNLYYTDARADARVALIVDSAPGTLNTLNELAAALGDDANFSTTVTNSIAAKLPLAGGTMTGQVEFPSSVSNRPVLTGGFLSRQGSDGDADIWGISETYYPSEGTEANAWGIRWASSPNQIQFVGANANKVTFDLDNGAINSVGTISSGAITSTGSSSFGDVAIGGAADSNYDLKVYGLARFQGAANFVDATNPIQVGGTTVIDASRNLTNIGTISSGAITATGTSTFATSISAGTTSNTDTLHLYKYQADHGIRIQGSSSNWYIYNEYSDGGKLHITDNTSQDTITVDTGGNTTISGTISSGAITSTGVSSFSNGTSVGNVELHTNSIGTDEAGILFQPNSAYRCVHPVSMTSTSHTSDISLGWSNNKWKDIYLAGYVKADSGYQIGTTTVIDSNRNLTNIVNSTSTGLISNIRTSALAPNDSSAGLRLEYSGGDASGDIGSGIVFAQRWYNQSTNNVRTGGIAGFKGAGSGAFGGGLKFYTQPQSGSNMNLVLTLDKDTNATFAGTISSGAITSSGAISGTNGAFSGSLALSADSSQLQLGTGNRAQIFHNSAALYLRTSTGGVNVQASGLNHYSADASTLYFSAASGGLSFGGTQFLTSSRNLTNIGTISSGAITSTGLVLNGGRTAEGVTAAGTYAELTRASGGDLGLLFNKDTSKWLIGIDNSDGNAANLRFMYGAYNASAHPGFGSDYSGLNLTYQGRVGVGTRYPGAELEVAGTALVENAKLKAIAESNSDTAVDVFVYDTRKDSDGGAWRKRTQNTSWYNETLNTSTRGARKEFPCVAVIVALPTAGNNVTIYDGDDPDLPMWMKFTLLNQDQVSIAAINGLICLGNKWTANAGYGGNGLVLFDFVADRSRHAMSNGTVPSYDPERFGVISGNQASTSIWPKNSANAARFYTLVDYSINDVAVTVLPNAPIDADTGLPVPTIAVATQGGVSVIKDDGQIYDLVGSNWASVSQTVQFDNKGILYFSQWNYSAIGCDVKGLTQDHTNLADGRPSYIATVDTYPFFQAHGEDGNGWGQWVDYATGSRDDFDLAHYSYYTAPFGRVVRHQTNHDLWNVYRGDSDLMNYTSNTYNTGWMHGDIKLATLSDTDTTDAVGAELISGGNFSNWTTRGGAGFTVNGNGTASLSNGDGTTDGWLDSPSFSTVNGKTYVVRIETSSNSGTGFGIYYNYGNGPNGYLFSRTFTFVANGGTTTLSLYRYLGHSGTSTLDSISVRLAEPDRSVNNNGVQVFGTVTKTAVATGADLVGYSGFSHATGGNYLRKPYHSGLDLGTGDFVFSIWCKLTAASSQYDFLWEPQTSGNSHRFYILRNISTGNLYLPYATDVADTFIPIGLWTKVDIVRQNNIASQYINGKKAGISYTSNQNLNASASAGNHRYTHIGCYHGGSYGWNGSIALARVSATAPTAEQIKKMYNDEKHLFQENAKATLYGSSDAVTALAYDDDTELLHVGTSAGRSVFQGLNRVDNTTDAVGTAISASNGFIVEE